MNIRKAVSADAPEIATVHIKSWQTTYKDIIPENYLSSLSKENKKRSWEDRLSLKREKIFTYVACNDKGRIVGFSLGSLEQQMPIGMRFREHLYKGELRAIYILKHYQRKGIGTNLAFRMMKHLLEHNIQGMITWVLKDNSSSNFYKSLYGKFIGDGLIEIGGVEYIKYAYGWNNLFKTLKKVENNLK
ncbi:MAG: GNAT family N-acetyltransferase [Candidatus Lokiarchaeota archaeon]